MSLALKLFFVVALASACWVSNTAWAVCNVCNEVSRIACINATYYNLCNSNNLPTGLINQCPDGAYCTTRGMRCTSDASLAACPDAQAVAGCGCTAAISDVIACTSRTQYVVCDEGVATTQTGTCPDGFVCNSNPTPKKICVPDTCYMPTCDRAPVVPA